MSVRTYNPSVRVGNWNEDIQLEEDTLKDFLERRDEGQLLIQKSANLKNSVLKAVDLNISRDGKVHFGDKLMLVNPGSRDGSRGAASLCLNVTDGPSLGVVGSGNSSQPCARNTFIIKSLDGTPEGESLKYGQAFYLCTSEGENYLYSDRASFQRCAKKSRHSEVTLVTNSSRLTEWIVVPFDPLFRMELEWSDVPANQKIIFSHARTNQNLCLEQDHKIRSAFGSEFEVSCFTDLDSHKAENDTNHWLLMMEVPGDSVMPVSPPQPDAQQQE